jgi:uncharacterized Zn-binding protein involved in type VI secretion
MGKPAARITDMHTCPMVNPGPVPHVGGPVVVGSVNVFTGKLPQARVGDMLVCVGPPDVIAVGSTGVFVNNMPAARLGDQTAHGGVIVVGLPTVLIGEQGGGGGGGAASDLAALTYAMAVQQAQVLAAAAMAGTPFCEICFKKAQAAEAAKLATAKALTAKATPQKPVTPPLSAPCAKLAQARTNAQLAKDVYDPGKAVPDGYTYLDPNTPKGREALNKLGVDPKSLQPTDSDFRAAVYQNGKDYVVSYKGTQSKADWIQNAKQGVGFESDHYNRAKILATDVHDGAAAQGGEVSFTGHSLGGGMASAAAVTTNRPATTFNSAGLHANTVANSTAKPPVDAYYVPGEVLSGVQDNRGVVLGGIAGLASAISPVLGAGVTGWLLGTQAMGKPVLPQAYGERHALPAAVPANKTWTQQHNPVDKHGMEWVIAGLEEDRKQKGCP